MCDALDQMESKQQNVRQMLLCLLEERNSHSYEHAVKIGIASDSTPFSSVGCRGLSTTMYCLLSEPSKQCLPM